jgi:hypothetical protein
MASGHDGKGNKMAAILSEAKLYKLLLMVWLRKASKLIKRLNKKTKDKNLWLFFWL